MSKNIPYTRQRQTVWGFFSGSTRAATITEAAEALTREGIGQATVYRAVTLFSELGLLCRVQDSHGEICYTAIRIGHNHPLICSSCREVVDFDGEGDLNYLERRLAEETGFVIYGHHLEVYGLCAVCAAAEAERVAADASAATIPAPVEA